MDELDKLVREGWQLSVFEFDYAHCGGGIIALIVPYGYSDIKEYLELDGDDGGGQALGAFVHLLYPFVVTGDSATTAITKLNSNINDHSNIYDGFDLDLQDISEVLRVCINNDTCSVNDALYFLSMCFSKESDKYIEKVSAIYYKEVKSRDISPDNDFIPFLKKRVETVLKNKDKK